MCRLAGEYILWPLATGQTVCWFSIVLAEVALNQKCIGKLISIELPCTEGIDLQIVSQD